MESSADENEISDVDDNERTAIKQELSNMSFEDLQKLKEKIGAKVYKEVVFGKNKNNERPKMFTRENKNRPREVSAKKPVKMQLDIGAVKKKEVRDPRFDPLCGTFDKKQFNQDYGFLSDMRMNDMKAIRNELKQTTDPDKQLQLRRLLQRLKDKHRASKREKFEKEKRSKEIELVEEEFKQGRQPHFKNKSELRVESLVQQYEELKKKGSGRIQRHLKRRQQKIKKKSFKTPVGVD
ncbi:ribosomal RNA processing protein 36 homolog [Zerene cesonia]|uniref:ribosomal RNA processing protein 36 homolog n=1 Tax=Zerene cesonia TaxID=33412 RepID=UPI0018E52BDF|nr:ribosomal RNA processing protein 36 homolog [Zerene cesonia]